MRIVSVEPLIDTGGFSGTKEWQIIYDHITKAIKTVDWPPGSGSFTLYSQCGKKPGEGNGVAPIKSAFMRQLKSFGWILERPCGVDTVKKSWKMDACFPVSDRVFALEWPTGNSLSSHGIMNKMALGMIEKVMIGGVLIVPSYEMHRFLANRVGHLAEIRPYFRVWRSIRVDEGLLAVIAVQHDAVSKHVPLIPKVTDARASRHTRRQSLSLA
ncbi:MAG: hypothetical protein HY914_23345 [Desulfomonile tiedjei]|nr:hypothetical protein [Desulfomonile tiedjei]